MAFEPVHTMTDWYDGPRRGVATVNGLPHIYESCWSDIDSDDEIARGHLRKAGLTVSGAGARRD